MPGNVFCLQLADAFGNRRRIAVRIGVTALLATPFIFVNMPARAQAAGIVMVIMFTSFFGASVSYARLRSDQRLERLTLLPISPGTLYLDLILASILARLAPVLAIVTGFIITNGQAVTPTSLICLAGLLCSSLLLLTLLGIGTGHLARSNGEVHLFGALVCAVLAFISGLTPLQEKLMWLTATTPCNPISRLLSLLIKLTTEPVSVPITEFFIASLILAAFIVTAVLRWISGRMSKTE